MCVSQWQMDKELSAWLTAATSRPITRGGNICFFNGASFGDILNALVGTL